MSDSLLEEWRDIVGYEGLYQVSDSGMVKSVSRMASHKAYGLMRVDEKILKPCVLKSGYSSVVLSVQSKTKSLLVHRIVSAAFIPNPESKPHVNHKNGIKTDNRAINLEWCTRSENELHAFRIGLKSHVGEMHNQSKLTKEQVIEIRRGDKLLKTSQLAKNYSVTVQTIYDIRSGKSWKHI